MVNKNVFLLIRATRTCVFLSRTSLLQPPIACLLVYLLRGSTSKQDAQEAERASAPSDSEAAVQLYDGDREHADTHARGRQEVHRRNAAAARQQASASCATLCTCVVVVPNHLTCCCCYLTYNKQTIKFNKAALVVPQFDDESSSSGSEDEGDAPVYSSPVRRPQSSRHYQFDEGSEDNNNSGESSIPDGYSQPQQPAAPGEFKWDASSVNDIQHLTNANSQLVSQATEFKRQIKSYTK